MTRFLRLFKNISLALAACDLTIEKLAAAGFAAFIIDYRGYGKSEGRPSEAGLYADGRAAMRWARERAKGAPLIICGESLGCAVAIETVRAAAPAG